MRLINALILSGLVIAMLPAIPVRAEDNIRVETGTLICGNAIVTARTSYLDTDSIDNQVLDQRLILTNARTNQHTQLVTDGRYVIKHVSGKHKVLDAAVESWACLRSSYGKNYIYLLYYCTALEEKGICASGKVEWMRILREDGMAVDKSPRHWTITRADNDLYMSLGLEKAIQDSQAKGIDEP